MQYILALVLITILTIVFSTTGCRKTPPENGKVDSPATAENPVKAKSTSVSKAALKKKLADLKKKPVPDNRKMGAMCYEVMGPPDRLEYICPSCGNKTLYAIAPKNKNEIKATWALTQLIQFEIQNARRIAATIKDIDLILDETGFCSHCSEEKPDPRIILTVTIQEQKHTTKGITPRDLTLIKEFLNGSLIHKGEQDQETPLKDYAKRIELLLGLKSE